MKLPRAVIMDLLPLYMAGEASPETRALIEAHLAEDPELARTVRQESAQDPPRLAAVVGSDGELRALLETRKRLRLRSWIIGLAIVLTLFPLSFSYDRRGFHWAWADSPLFAAFLGALAVGLWGFYFRLRRRNRLS